MNITEITEIGGKKLSKSQINLLAKLAGNYSVTLPAGKETRMNPYTGVKNELEPLAVALFDFIIDNYRKGLVKGSTMESLSNPKAIPTALWDRSRYFFLAFWPKEFYNLID